jgi:hypothetical protein
MKVQSEVLTMQFLRRRTSIPHIYLFDSTFKNDLNCPYILIEFVTGKQLSSLWHDNSSSEELKEIRRVNALKEIAYAVLELTVHLSPGWGTLVSQWRICERYLQLADV